MQKKSFILFLIFFVGISMMVFGEDTEKKLMPLDEFLEVQADNSILTPALAYRLRTFEDDLVNHNVTRLAAYFSPGWLNSKLDLNQTPSAAAVESLFKKIYSSHEEIVFTENIERIQYENILDISDHIFIVTQLTLNTGKELGLTFFFETKTLFLNWPFGGK